MNRYNTVETNFFGPNAVQLLPQELKKRGYKIGLVVTDPFLYEARLSQKICDELEAVAITTFIYYDVEQNPTVETVEATLMVAKEINPDFIIALGGGSVIDTCKAVSILFTNEGAIQSFEGVNKSKNKGLPIVAINTTAGTGSEVTTFYVITDKLRNSKMVMVDEHCITQIAVNDSSLMTSMPKGLTAATGMDALTHAIEAILSLDATPFTDKDAIWAINTINDNLLLAYQDGNDLEARTMMAYAQYSAGTAFSNAGLGMVHAMAHSLGGFYNLPHGICNAVLLPYVLGFTGTSEILHPRFKIIHAALGLKQEKWYSHKTMVNQVINRILTLSKQLGIKSNLRDLGVKEEDFIKLAELALIDTCMGTNPLTVTQDEIVNVYKKAFNGI